MSYLPLVLAICGFAASLRSAWLWYAASRVGTLPDWASDGRIEPVDPIAAQQEWTIAVLRAGHTANALNALGAKWTAGAVVLSAASLLAAEVVGRL
jgi:hypothetical protein